MIKTLPILTLNTLEDHMIFIEGGTFQMGGESGYDDSKPVHPVKLKDFYLCRYQVTQALWDEVMKKEESPAAFSHPHRPIEQVSWYDVVEFCNLLNERLGLESYYTIDKDRKDPNNKNSGDDLKWYVTINPEANGYHLPTEAEWEYAARGGKYGQNLTFAGSNNLKEVGWYDKNSLNISHRVGLKVPNELGLFDMSGNVYEWCHDWFNDTSYQNSFDKGTDKNPKGPNAGNRRVVRGGSWLLYNVNCRVAFRVNGSPYDRDVDFGFRLSRY